MRSENYALQEQTFTRFTVPHMLRAALIEGLKPDNDRNIPYRELVKQFTKLDVGTVNRLHYLLQESRLTRGQWQELENILHEVRPRGNSNWKNLNYDVLGGEGVIKPVQGSIDAIVDQATNGVTWEVFVLGNPVADAGVDYKKHVQLKNELRIDSKTTIEAFSQARNMPLPGNYDGRMSADLLQRLGRRDFTLPNAVEISLETHHDNPNKQSLIRFSNYTTGDDVRIFPTDLVEMLEHFMYFKRYQGSTADFRLGDVEQKYAGSKTLIVPKRRPDEHFEFNQATVEYLAEFNNAPFIDSTWWLNFRAECDCIYAKEKALFNDRRGQTVRKPMIFDPHIGGAFLTLLDGLESDPRLYLPIPSRDIIDLADQVRFNMYETATTETASLRRPVREEGINIMLLHAMKSAPYEALSKPGSEKVSPYVLRPLHA
tara:strand:+ start:4194 stop:5480 length:1287 start_codon:yes stop_codon:yes gene_type:complete